MTHKKERERETGAHMCLACIKEFTFNSDQYAITKASKTRLIVLFKIAFNNSKIRHSILKIIILSGVPGCSDFRVRWLNCYVRSICLSGNAILYTGRKYDYPLI